MCTSRDYNALATRKSDQVIDVQSYPDTLVDAVIMVARRQAHDFLATVEP